MNEMRIFDKQNSQSGQALVEYILLLVIAIALILGLMNQLYKPFSGWLKSYMGEYLECLLDAGELPTMGGGSGICPQKFANFSLSNGRPSLKNNHSGGSGSENSPNEKVRKGGETSSSTASSSGGGSSSRRGQSGFPIGQKGGADGPGSEASEKQITEAASKSQYFKFRSSSSGSLSEGTANSASNGGMTVPIPASKVRDRGEKSMKVAKEVESENRTQAKKLIITPPERKTAAIEEDQPWSIAQYLKFALILMIVVAIVLFLGGQILQISKSMEK